MFALGVPHLGGVVVTLLILATAAVLVGSWRFTLTLGLRSSADTLTAWLVVLAAQICLLVLGVGLAGQLRPGPLALSAVAASAAQLVWSLTGGRGAASRSGRQVWAVIGDGLRRSWRHPVVLVLGLLVLGQYLWRLATALRFPVLDWDGNFYHLISVDTWVQQEAVTHSRQVVWADALPQNSELITAWSTTFLHSTWLAGLTQFLFVAMGIAAVAGIASNAGASRSRAAMAGLLFAATPIVFLQAGTAYVDVAASASVLATWQLLLSAHDLRGEPRRVRRRVTRHFLVAGLGLGMMLGTKSSNVLPVGLGIAVAVLVLLGLWRGLRAAPPTEPLPPAPTGGEPIPISVGSMSETDVRAGAHGGTAVLTARPPAAPAVAPATTPAVPDVARFRRWGTVPLGALVVPAVLVGGFWYIRNLVTYGNPMWPITVPFFEGKGSLQELVLGANAPPEIADLPPLTQIARSWSEDLFPHAYMFDQRLGGFGPQWLLLAPAIAVMILGFLRDRVVYLVGLVLPFAVLFLLHPSAWWSRYTIFVAGLGAVCYVLAVQWLAGKRERLLHIGLVVLVAFGMWWTVSTTHLSANKADPLSLSEAVGLLRADEATRSSTRYPWNGYADLADAPPGSTIAIPDRNTMYFTHPYAGTELDRRLVVVPTPRDLGALHATLVGVGADYVVLGQDAEPTASLAKEALLDGDRFIHVGATFEGLLFTVESADGGGSRKFPPPG